jgi:preprotein translocase subunit YajC
MTDRWDRSRLLSKAVDGPTSGGFSVNTMLTALVILFAADGDVPVNPGNPLTGLLPAMPMIGIIAAAYYFFLHLPMKRERTRQATMWSALKKNDRVLTSSGIIGVVTNVGKESNPPEVTLRIDESTNAKLRVTLTSIVQVLGDEPSADTPSK